MALLFFLVQVFVISFSGAMQPGPVTVTAIAMGARSRWAGALLAVGHGIVEFPLMVLIILGAGTAFKQTTVRTAIGFAGGIVLLYMASAIFISSFKNIEPKIQAGKDRPVWAGIVLTAGNPYFLIWWTTVGLALATTAREFGIWAFGLFAIVHWLVDLGWVSSLSFASFYGTTLLGPRRQKTVLKICAAATFFFGLYFIYSSAGTLFKAA